MLKILFAAAEAMPFAKTGGLGDVVGTLPRELNKQKVDARVILPKHSAIAPSFRDQMKLIKTLKVPVGWREQYCGVEMLEYQGVIFYFIDNEEYFKRPSIYGHWDEGECYAYFCRAVLECLPELDFKPDVIHCHDWHAGMIPVFLKAFYQENAFYKGIHTLYTIHNLRYQGIFPKELVPDILGLDWEYFNSGGIEFYDQVSFMKAGLYYADLISTVSKTYAQEIQYPFYGEQLDGFLRSRNSDLNGIINGIDYDEYNPETDNKIFVNYDAKNSQLKQENKLHLQEKLGLPTIDVPMLGIVSRLVGPKGLDLIERILHELVATEDLQVVVLGTGEEKYEDLFRTVAWQYPDRVSAHIYFNDSLARQIYAASDMFLMPSVYEPCGIGQLIAMRYGSVPIVRETGGLKDTVQPYNQHSGKGNGFTFTNYNAHDMLFTIKRALGFYENQKTWKKIVANAMKADYSWENSAKQYKEVYTKISKM
ncbi:MAG: glycogen synthase GlgA [Pelosinus sp.]|nr:glycogen synthase GlgA [Pelosinus sp.]